MAEYIESICRRCFHSYVCEQFNEHRDDNNKKCHFFNDHFAPAADVAPVVRCKDCKYYTTEDFDGDILCGCTLYCAMLDITPDGFCSYGERKDGEG